MGRRDEEDAADFCLRWPGDLISDIGQGGDDLVELRLSDYDPAGVGRAAAGNGFEPYHAALVWTKMAHRGYLHTVGLNEPVLAEAGERCLLVKVNTFYNCGHD